MEDEDSLTGDLGAQLRTDVRTYLDTARGTEWTWQITSHKFRGRGPAATENLLGADGVIELIVSVGDRHAVKSLLFQAKNNWSYDSSLVGQSRDMATWRNAAMVFNYRPGGYEAYDRQQVEASGGSILRTGFYYPLEMALGDLFLSCERGGLGIYYDPIDRELIWPARGGLVKGSFLVKNQVTIGITNEFLPKLLQPVEAPRLLRPSEFSLFPLRQPRRSSFGGRVYPSYAFYESKGRV